VYTVIFIIDLLNKSNTKFHCSFTVAMRNSTTMPQICCNTSAFILATCNSYQQCRTVLLIIAPQWLCSIVCGVLTDFAGAGDVVFSYWLECSDCRHCNHLTCLHAVLCCRQIGICTEALCCECLECCLVIF